MTTRDHVVGCTCPSPHRVLSSEVRAVRFQAGAMLPTHAVVRSLLVSARAPGLDQGRRHRETAPTSPRLTVFPAMGSSTAECLGSEACRQRGLLGIHRLAVPVHCYNHPGTMPRRAADVSVLTVWSCHTTSQLQPTESEACWSTSWQSCLFSNRLTRGPLR